MAEFAFCPQALDKCIYFEMDATAVDAAEPDLVVWIVSRESQISDSAGWERLGSVCTPEKLLDLYENKAAGCGAKGFQMNIDAADEQGCRQVFFGCPLNNLEGKVPEVDSPVGIMLRCPV